MSQLGGILGKGSSSLLVPAGACIVGCVVGGLVMKKISGSSSSDKIPEKWVKVGEIKDLIIYPIKGIRGISVQEAVLGRLGLKDLNNSHLRDRVFLILKDGKHFSLQKLPILSLVEASFEGDKLRLSYIKDPSMDVEIDIPTGEDPSRMKSVELWGEHLKAVDCGEKVAAWLTRLTETPGLRLVYHVRDQPQRGAMKRNMRFPGYRESHTGSFQDETSYMLMTDESVAAVNAHLEKPVKHASFRPTIVVTGISEPFAEDFWGYIRIGAKEDDPILKGSAPCIRCKTTTIDPDTGEFRTDGEPLSTLYKLKRPVGDARTTKLVSKCAIMGTHFGVVEGQTNDRVVRVGDPVYAAVV